MLGNDGGKKKTNRKMTHPEVRSHIEGPYIHYTETET